MTILVLDGGMGTTLEALGHDVSGRLWGGELAQRDPRALAHVHAQFAAAGADIVSTATYQVSHQAVKEVSDSADAEAAKIMQKAVGIARDAAPGKRIALSLGPYGATLYPSQEYDGLYPPPFGPQGWVKDKPSLNAAKSAHDETSYQQALMDWHLQRLRLYSSDEQTWQAISYIAFETIPVLREIRAIRGAMRLLRDELSRQRPGEEHDKPFWISSAYPTGRPIQTSALDGQPVELQEVVDALLGSPRDMAVPDGIGINCTKPSQLPILVEDLNRLVMGHNLDGIKPWLVIYPDSGAVYDVVRKTWSEPGDTTPEAWGDAVTELGRAAESTGLWAGVIIGGCCKTSFEHIHALRRAVDSNQTP